MRSQHLLDQSTKSGIRRYRTKSISYYKSNTLFPRHNSALPSACTPIHFLGSSHLRHRSTRPSLLKLAKDNSTRSSQLAAAEGCAASVDPAYDFDWILCLSLAGYSFEAYNGLDPGPGDTPPPHHQESIGGTRVTYIDPHFLRTRMSGLLDVTVICGKGLKAADVWFTSDPYCLISVGGSVSKTPTVPRSLDPVWNHHASLFVTNLKGQRLNVRVLDEDIGKSDDFLGAGMRGLADLEDGKPREIQIPLTGGTGSVTLKVQFESFLDEKGVLSEASLGRMGGPVVGSPASALLSSPWRDLAKSIIPTSSDHDYLGLEAMAFIDNPEADTQVWIFWNPDRKKVVLAFRGTEQEKFQDVLTDLQLVPATMDPEGELAPVAGASPAAAIFKGVESVIKGLTQGGKGSSVDVKAVVAEGAKVVAQTNAEINSEMWAHTGFLKAYKAVRAEVLQLVDALVGNESNAWTIYVSGHSLGGALSTLCSYELATRRAWKGGKPEIINYSFGSPRVGNKTFAEAFNQVVPNCWRVVNNNDAVALVPRLIGYAHVGHMVRLTPEGNVVKELDSIQGISEGTGVVDIAAAMLTTALTAESIQAGIEKPSKEVVAVLEAEKAAMSSLLDGSAVAEHLVRIKCKTQLLAFYIATVI